ncbi:hypothetical protein ACSQ67_017780 [Phaseolus vulgaris]
MKKQTNPHNINKNETEGEKGELEQWRWCITDEGPSSGGAAAARIAVTDSVFDLVESMLEHSEPKEHADGDDHHNQAHAKHAHSTPTTHLPPVIHKQTKVSVFFFWVFGIWEIRMPIRLGRIVKKMGNLKGIGKEEEEEKRRQRLVSLSRFEEVLKLCWLIRKVI